ncbi:uncharacterized protein cubi_02251 [Cryptosporidium ubiquitum]|uniref:Uncharacterized protein n=1 Tax=Cryptosporidium ubiquitum TaxID=857276 RepID=A0A1J4MJ12_9CRYT|nr:uncharacterized protein cubi_02251 [Cryptosporidium ubiquitum]OII73020.1 hypothetical protein cubi_02251 [Cryptosporidium ubiquitum]
MVNSIVEVLLMDSKSQFKAIKRKVIDSIIKLGENELILKQTAVTNIGILLDECKSKPSLENVKQILVEILMSMIAYSTVDSRIQNLDHFVSDIPHILDLPNIIRFQSMTTLLNSCCYNELDIIRRLSSIIISGVENEDSKYLIPANVIRPLLERIVNKYKNDMQIINETINFLFHNRQCINNMIGICFDMEEYDLLHKFLLIILPIIDINTLSNIFNFINVKIITFNLHNSPCQHNEINSRFIDILYLMMVNNRCEFSLINILITIIPHINIQKETNFIILSLIILSSIIENSRQEEKTSNNLGDPIQMIRLLKLTLENGGINGIIDRKLDKIKDLMFIILTILLYKSKDISEFEVLVEVIELFLKNFNDINVIILISALVYHIKGDLIENDPFCCYSKKILKEKFKFNGIEELKSIEFSYSSSEHFSGEDIYDEINTLMTENSQKFIKNEWDNNTEDIKNEAISIIYNGLYLALNYVKIRYFLENNLVNNYIYDEIYCFSIISIFIERIIKYIESKNPKYCQEIVQLAQKFLIFNNKYQIKIFDSLFPIYEFILRQSKQISEIDTITDSLHYSIISFGNNKNTIPIVYNKIISAENQLKTKVLEKIYYLFLKGELPYSKLESFLINQIDSELSNTNNALDKYQNGIKILFCVIRYKPDIVDEVIIGKIQNGLNSSNKDVVSYSLHCLIELCKFGIIDYDKCIKILLAIHSNILIIDFNLPNNITQLKVINNQNFGTNNSTYPVEILSSFLRFFGLYIDQKWPSENESYQKKIPNNLFYILSMLTKIIRDKAGLESVYCLSIFSKIILDFFYQHINMDITLKSFLSWCIELSFSAEIGNFFDLLDILQQFIIIMHKCNRIDFNTLQFFLLNISSPLKTILNFELVNEIFFSKKQTNNQQFGMYNMNIKYNTIEDNFAMKDTFLESIEGNSNIKESSELIMNKLKSIKAKTTHNYYIQEILGLFLYNSKQVRIEVMKNIDQINIEEFKINVLKDLFKFIRNIKFISCATFQWQMIFQFIKILKEYFNQLEFIFVELVPRSKNNKITSNIEQETLFLFFLLLSYLPSVNNLDSIFNENSDLIKKCKLIRDGEKQLFDELFIENQAILILFLSSLVILRYDILNHLYESYISEIANLEILPNKLFITFVNSDIMINKHFSNKNCLLQYFIAKEPLTIERNTLIQAFQQQYYINKEINTIDFVSCLLKHLHQHGFNHLDILNKYFTIANEDNFNIYTNYGTENQLLEQICVTSSANLINSYTFGVFSFFDIAFDSFSEKDKLLDHLLYLYLSMNNDPKNIANLVFRTASAVKLFQHEMLTVYQIFEYINHYFILSDSINHFNNGVTQEINFQLGLIRAFCFSFVNYYLKKMISTNGKQILKNEQIFMIEEYTVVNMNIVKYLISTIFYENSSNENQAFIISCIKLLKGYYWVPWISFLYNKSLNNFDILNEICGIIHKNQLSSIKTENKNVKLFDKYSNIDLLLQSCVNDPIKMSICILLLSFQTINLSTSLENKLNFHNKEKYFDIKMLNKNTLFFVSILKLDSYTFRLKNKIENIQLNNKKLNFRDIVLQDLVMIGVIIELFETTKICDKFTNFDISNSLDIIFFQIIIPLCDLILLKSEDDENKLILEWFITLITKFLISYLSSNNNFAPKVIEFGYSLVNIFKKSKFNNLIMLGFTRTVGVILFTSDSNFSQLHEFIINIFDTLSNLESFEMQITTLFVNLNSVFNSAAIFKKPLINIKIDVLIKSLGEISYKLHRFYNNPIINSFKLLINTIYDFLNSINQKSIISNLLKSIHPLFLDALILENKLSIKIIHEFYLNLEIQEINYELIYLANFYYLYSLKNESAESEILNFLYKDFIESGDVSLKRTVVITYLLLFILIPDSTSFLFNYCFNKDLQYNNDNADSEENIVNNWIDLRNIYLLDLEDNPKLRVWNELFFNNDGIIFLSKFYYSIKQQLFSTIDTNLFYDKEIISFSLYEYPKVFLFDLECNVKFDTWRKSVSNLLFYSKCKTINVDQYPCLEYNSSFFLEISHKLLFKLKNKDLKISLGQFKNILKVIIKKLIETNGIKKI